MEQDVKCVNFVCNFDAEINVLVSYVGCFSIIIWRIYSDVEIFLAVIERLLILTSE